MSLQTSNQLYAFYQDIAGYIGYQAFGVRSGIVLYANTIMIDTSNQGRDFAGALIDKSAEIEKLDYTGLQTQSAQLYATAKKTLKDIQPDLDTSSIFDQDVWQSDVEMSAIKEDTFPVIQKAYGAQPPYDDRPAHPRYINFYNSVDFSAGDVLYCIDRPLVDRGE